MSVRICPGFGQARNEERQEAVQERKKTRFGETDADKNGKVTPWEFRAQRWK